MRFSTSFVRRVPGAAFPPALPALTRSTPSVCLISSYLCLALVVAFAQLPYPCVCVAPPVSAVFLRSYTNPLDPSLIPNIKLWEAARATSAAPYYFEPIKVGKYELVDGGLGANNPLGWFVTTYFL